MTVIFKYPNKNFNPQGIEYIPRVGELIENSDSGKLFKVTKVKYKIPFSQKPDLPNIVEITLEYSE
ncbi:hypothetical protein [Puniceicoccus vermicola]|uniref:Uncharacterized protein n=1 Tax=Puniceicoccus vermicola TaxID=388746 RepID=A0A7X1AVC3_9BACT|nr:hypothetical protein [Puniceicoccus vermicola]MBC2600569.1 hypothetical protein [Puniceicoccus vermicola]